MQMYEYVSLPMSFKTSKMEDVPRVLIGVTKKEEHLCSNDSSVLMTHFDLLVTCSMIGNSSKNILPNGGSKWWFGRVRKKSPTEQTQEITTAAFRFIYVYQLVRQTQSDVKQGEGIPFPEPTVCPSKVVRTQHLFFRGKLFVSGSVYQEYNNC